MRCTYLWDAYFSSHIFYNIKVGYIITGFVTIGTLFDVGVWYFVKNVKIFDEEVEMGTMPDGTGNTQ